MADEDYRRLAIYADTEERVNEIIRRSHNVREGPLFSEDTLSDVGFDKRLGMALDALEDEIEQLQQGQHSGTAGAGQQAQTDVQIPELPRELRR
ncbi:hypothetical protein M0R89_10470 [Halorussus limi]|uniref:Uncharacterized protein n=1 Tax=Halorussus limi TaxID=2938695 RepID=A0A8U0HPK4_9EURY|nr:hypothetical protein [Halorussus limi]UPV72972.1 hypothetical protein M0R89_10470 [Halorussus limi]